MELPSNCTLFLMATPLATSHLATCRFPLAHLAYRVGNGPHLYRTDLRYPAKGGVLVADRVGFTGGGNGEQLAQQVERECLRNGFSGAFFDFEGAVDPTLQAAITALLPVFQRHNWKLYLPEPYAVIAPASQIVISSALSGGSLRQRLSEVISQYGADHVTIGLEWVRMDFTLPATGGVGKPLSPAELEQLRSQRGHAVYFSDELCAHYFTYMNTGSDAHFVLFDDTASIVKKLLIAASLGISQAFLPIPEDSAQLHELLS